MCAILGALVWNLTTPNRIAMANALMNEIWTASHERGRDGRGYVVSTSTMQPTYHKDPTRVEKSDGGNHNFFPGPCSFGTLIGNLRAEPTTEHVAEKVAADQQPYTSGEWSIVHNGTIANDKQLRHEHVEGVDTSIDSAAIAETLNSFPTVKMKADNSLPPSYWHFKAAIERLKGSYAILATYGYEPARLFVAANYRPIWYINTEVGVFFASSRDYLPGGYPPLMIDPYSVSVFEHRRDGQLVSSCLPLLAEPEDKRALVVCSGGLDSVVAATVAQRREGWKVELIHFRYGSRAQLREEDAIRKVADALGVNVTFMDMPIYAKSDSPLLDWESKVAGGEAGAEFAHEWVPARNLVMLSIATAYAEAKGFDTVVLGNNLEEAGAYPDNEPEFIARFNDMLPFAVADGKRVRVEMPVGNLMKHEIVALGHAVGAPMHLTWSCYRRGEKHCGACGPCYMRRKAFEINGLPEVIEYVSG